MNGDTPLLMAIEWEEKGVIDLLLAHEKVDINLTDDRGQTPLLVATERGLTEIVKLLLAREPIEVDSTNDKWSDATPCCHS